METMLRDRAQELKFLGRIKLRALRQLTAQLKTIHMRTIGTKRTNFQLPKLCEILRSMCAAVAVDRCVPANDGGDGLR